MKILVPEYGTLFPVHKTLLPVADSAVKDNKKGFQVYNFLSQNRRT
jgi:hypothetical protein